METIWCSILLNHHLFEFVVVLPQINVNSLLFILTLKQPAIAHAFTENPFRIKGHWKVCSSGTLNVIKTQVIFIPTIINMYLQ